MMTRKDFQLLADALKNARPAEKHGILAKLAWEVSVHSVSHALLKINPRFDKVKFKEACGVYP
jgi:hypothetical protein